VFGATTLLLGLLMLALLRPTTPYLRDLSGKLKHDQASLGQAMLQLYQTYTNRSIVAIMGAAVCLSAAVGMTSALWVYFMQFYFGLASNQLVLIQITYLIAAILAIFAMLSLCQGRDKRRLALGIGIAFWIVDLLPYALRTLGMLPENGDPALLPLLIVYSLFDGLLINLLMALVMSMLTDIVEDNLMRTGRREEGVVLAGQTLVAKCSTALGTMGGGLLLTFVSFPQLGANSTVSAAILWELGAVYWAAMWLLGALWLLILRRYTIRRVDHQRNLSAITEGYLR
jgi:glycoside/pentoside/hexuronide:cation symporter, GPH family